MLDCFSKVVRQEGPLALFRGITPNFLKAIPAISLSYAVYEQMKLWMNV
jgi:solute carrier family 25 (mitochondrial phosphate transporter), member 23/24/25/41